MGFLIQLVTQRAAGDKRELSVVIERKTDDVIFLGGGGTGTQRSRTSLIWDTWTGSWRLLENYSIIWTDHRWGSSEDFRVSERSAGLLVCMHEAESRQRGYFSTGQEWFSSPVKEHHSWVKALGISERGLQWPPREKLEVTAVFMCRPVIVLWTNCLRRYGFIHRKTSIWDHSIF